jgi:two-component system sensor histidine kinase BaeS
MRLSTKLLLSFALLLTVTLVVVSVVAYSSAAREVRGFMFGGTIVPPEEITTDLSTYYQERGGWQGVEAVLVPSRGSGAGGLGPMMGQRFVLVDATGRVVGDTSSTLLGSFVAEDEIARGVPITVKQARVGTLLLFGGMGGFGTPQGGLDALLIGRVNRAIWLAAGLGALLGLVLAVVLSRSLTAPLRSLTAAMNRFARGERNLHLPATSPDEVGDLTESFRHLVGEIERQEGLRKEMTADIAHELRNPIAVIQANVESLVDGVYPATAENLEPVLESVHLLSRLVEDLRTLALADAGRLTVEIGATDIIPVLRRVANALEQHAAAKQIRLTVESAHSVFAAADPQRLEQILSNLVNNAIRHTPEGGRVAMRVALQASGRVRIDVTDTGSGIPPDALAHVFERFYRADRGRSRVEGGTGLGLAIARKLAEAQGGNLTADNPPEGGARFSLTLAPAAG